MKLFYIRKTVQLVILLLIILAALSVFSNALLTLPWLSRFSPLMTISTRLAARQWTPYFCGGVLIGFICLLFPRFFCGWLCPLGTCIDIVDSASLANKRNMLILSCWTTAFIIFTGLIMSAAFGYDVAGYIDPLTIVGHTATTIGTGRPDSSSTNYYAGHFSHIQIIMLAVFSGILLLTIFGRRSWCRIFCPLGGLLGALATVCLNKRSVNFECIKCGKCRRVCRMGAIGANVLETEDQLCIYCNECQDICPKKAINFK